MKQLSALGARRHFFRGPRRRSLRGDIDETEMMGPGFGYYNGKLCFYRHLQNQNQIQLLKRFQYSCKQQVINQLENT